LYKGHIPNYIYNVPNKVYEYLACGLQVWYSKDLLTTEKLNVGFNDIENNTLIPTFLKVLHFKNYNSHDKIFVSKILSSV
jgi:hypothetical protein